MKALTEAVKIIDAAIAVAFGVYALLLLCQWLAIGTAGGFAAPIASAIFAVVALVFAILSK